MEKVKLLRQPAALIAKRLYSCTTKVGRVLDSCGEQNPWENETASQIHSCMTRKHCAVHKFTIFWITHVYAYFYNFFDEKQSPSFLYAHGKKAQRWSLNTPKFRIIPISPTQPTNQATLSRDRNVQLFIDIRCSGNQITDGRSIYEEGKTNMQRETQVHLAERMNLPVIFPSFLGFVPASGL